MGAGSAFPLIAGFATGAIVAREPQRAITIDEFLSAAAAVAEQLPDVPCVINVCEDRYWFLVAFAAALWRGVPNLLPHNRTPATLADVRDRYPGAIFASDQQQPDARLAGLDVRTAAARAVARNTPAPAIAAAQTAAIVFTSGSTGTPKPNVKTWGSMVHIARRTAQRFGLGTGRAASIVATVPQQHMYGLETSILLPIQHGHAFHGGKPFYPEDVRSALENVPAPRVLVTTPVHLRACLAEAVTLPAIELIISATAPLPVELAAQAEDRFGAPVCEIYGWSEAGSVATRRTRTDTGWRVFDDSTIALDATTGRFALNAACYPAPVLFEDVIEPRSDTEFRLVGRSQDMINVAGKRVSLGDLNTRICAIPGVRDAAFYLPGDGDDVVGRLAAFVVAPDVSPDAILDALRASVDAVFLPRPLIFLDRLPRNETGKLPLQQLDKLWQAHRAQ
jgi:acyl-coenzyme A synthetase/AMP-(fatty) acid ligase